MAKTTLKVALLASLIGLSSAASAVGSIQGKIFRLHLNPVSGLVLIQTNLAKTGTPPTCSNHATWDFAMKLPVNTPAPANTFTRDTLALLLTAQASGRDVLIQGVGTTCVAYSAAEDIGSVYMY